MSSIEATSLTNPQALPACLFENPNRPERLLEILRRIKAHALSTLSFQLGQMHQLTKSATGENGPSPASIAMIKASIDECLDDIEALEFRSALSHVNKLLQLLDKALSDAIACGSGEGWPHVNRFAFDLHGRLRDELEYTYVLAMRGGSQKFFDDDLFGGLVADKFSDANFDISEAGKCLAMGRHTASVFHSMRVLELGLQSLAHQLCPESKQVNWGRVLRDIEDAIGKMENDPRWTVSPNWRDQRESFSQAAAQFSVFRDAWRNHVAHNRRTYNQEQAESVFSAVKAFMQSLTPWLEQPDVSSFNS